MVQNPGNPTLSLTQQNLFSVRIEPRLIEGADPLNRKVLQLWTNKVPIAGRSINVVTVPTPYNDIDFPSGGKQKMEDFTLTFMLTEKLETYITLCQWLERNNPYKQLLKKPTPIDFNTKKTTEEWIRRAQDVYSQLKDEDTYMRDYRDIYIQLKTIGDVDYGFMQYVECFPYSIPSFNFDNASSEPIEVTVGFKYLYSDIVNLNNQSLIC